MNGSCIYDRYPDYYDLIHQEYGYREHAEALRALLCSLGVREGALLLEAACGTGSYLVCLRDHFEVAGFDLSEAMLARARPKLPGVTLFRADMRDFRVDKPVDVLVCLCSAIAYLPNRGALHLACQSFSRALSPGGVLLIRPWLTPSESNVNPLWMDQYDGPELKLCRQAVHRREGDGSVLAFHWLAASRQAGVEHFVDEHRLHLFSEAEMEDALRNAGLVNIGRASVAGIPVPLWIGRSAR